MVAEDQLFMFASRFLAVPVEINVIILEISRTSGKTQRSIHGKVYNALPFGASQTQHNATVSWCHKDAI